MICRKCILILLVLNSMSMEAQNYDNQWIFGYGNDEAERFGFTVLDFNTDTVTSSYAFGSDSIAVGVSGSFSNSVDGQLKYITNHCYVYDNVLENLTSDQVMTATGLSYDGCKSTIFQDYQAYSSVIILPDLIDDNLTYILHKDFIVEFIGPEFYTQDFWFSTIRETGEETVFERKYTINQEQLISLGLTAVPNHDMTRWWIVLARNYSNIFEVYSIGQDSAYLHHTDTLGVEIDSRQTQIGQAQFSPDASMFAMNTEEYGVLLYDFNNEDGSLSNFRQIEYPYSEDLAKGLCFSPDNSKIYVNSAEHLRQIDLNNNNLVDLIRKYTSAGSDGWPIGIGHMYLGPDCRIYVSPGSSTYYMHTIDSPNEAGQACGFSPERLVLPTRMPHHLPNIPQYRYINGCDSTIVLPEIVTFTEEVDADVETFRIYPNPVADFLTIDQLNDGENQVRIFDQVGRLLQYLEQYGDQISIDVGSLQAGMYFVKVNDKARIQKFIKI